MNPPVEVATQRSKREISPTIEAFVPPDSADGRREWIARDPHAAVDWAAQEPEGEKRDAVLVAACYEIASADPAEAVALAENFSLTNNATLENLAAQWAGQDFRAARKWALGKPAGRERNELIARVAYVWSNLQPAAAAEFVVQEIPPGAVQTEAAISILHQWALRNFAAAATWVDDFPDGEIRDRAVQELAGVREYSSMETARASAPAGPPHLQ